MKRFPVGFIPGPSVKEQFVENQVQPIPRTVIHNPRTREVFMVDTIALDRALQNSAVKTRRRAPAPERNRSAV